MDASPGQHLRSGEPEDEPVFAGLSDDFADRAHVLEVRDRLGHRELPVPVDEVVERRLATRPRERARNVRGGGGSGSKRPEDTLVAAFVVRKQFRDAAPQVIEGRSDLFDA